MRSRALGAPCRRTAQAEQSADRRALRESHRLGGSLQVVSRRSGHRMDRRAGRPVSPGCEWEPGGMGLRVTPGRGRYHLNPSSEPDPVRRSWRCDGGCRRAMRAPTVGIKRARYATPSTVAPAWSAKRCENARHQDSLRIAQALRRATQSALPVLHTALSGRDSGS